LIHAGYGARAEALIFTSRSRPGPSPRP